MVCRFFLLDCTMISVHFTCKVFASVANETFLSPTAFCAQYHTQATDVIPEL
jgi:hypothetical protein